MKNFFKHNNNKHYNAATLKRDMYILYNRIDIMSFSTINKGIGLHGGLLHLTNIINIYEFFLAFFCNLFNGLNLNRYLYGMEEFGNRYGLLKIIIDGCRTLIIFSVLNYITTILIFPLSVLLLDTLILYSMSNLKDEHISFQIKNCSNINKLALRRYYSTGVNNINIKPVTVYKNCGIDKSLILKDGRRCISFRK